MINLVNKHMNTKKKYWKQLMITQNRTTLFLSLSVIADPSPILTNWACPLPKNYLKSQNH